MAAAIEATLAGEEAATNRAREARALVEGRYCWERVVDQLEAVYGLRQERAA
jgi:hypothetical protein